MTRTVRSAFVLLLFVLSSVLIFPAATVLALDREVPAIVPASQTAGWWMAQHERNVARVRQGSIDLLMIGDFITQGWGDEGRRVWERYYAHRRAVNLGFNATGLSRSCGGCSTARSTASIRRWRW